MDLTYITQQAEEAPKDQRQQFQRLGSRVMTLNQLSGLTGTGPQKKDYKEESAALAKMNNQLASMPSFE